MTMPSGAASSRARNSRVCWYLSTGSRMEIATTTPRSVATGERVRSKLWARPLVWVRMQLRTVTSTRLSTTASTAIRWNSCIVSRPKPSTRRPAICSAGTPTTSLAPLFARRKTPDGVGEHVASSDWVTSSESAS